MVARRNFMAVAQWTEMAAGPRMKMNAMNFTAERGVERVRFCNLWVRFLMTFFLFKPLFTH